MHPISSRDENVSLSSTEEVSQLFTSNSRKSMRLPPRHEMRPDSLALELLVKSWLTSSVEDRASFSSRDDMGCTEHSSSCTTEIDDPLYLRRLSQGISRGS